MSDVFETVHGAHVAMSLTVPTGAGLVVLADGRSFAFSHVLDGGARCFREVEAVTPPIPPAPIVAPKPKKKAGRRGR